MFHRFRFVIIGALMVLASAAASYAAVSAAMPGAFFAAGETRYAAVSATNGIATSSSTYADMPNATVWITVPTGKTADVLIEFCGDASTSASTGLLVQAMVGSVVAAPGQRTLKYDDVGVATECVQFYKTGVTAGNKAVKIQWKQAGPGPANLYERSLIVTANIH